MRLQPTRSGFTLLEAIISTTILAALLLGATQTVVTGYQANEAFQAKADMQYTANYVLHRLAMELRAADREYILIDPDQDIPRWRFSICTGFDFQSELSGINDQNAWLGEPIYDMGECYRHLVYDKNAGTLVEIVENAGGMQVPRTLANGVKAFAIEANTAAGTEPNAYIVQSDTVTLQLTLSYEDSAGNEHTWFARRNVLLRASQFNSDGLSPEDIVSNPPQDTDQDPDYEETTADDGTLTDDDPMTGEITMPTAVEEPPPDINEPAGPSIHFKRESTADGVVVTAIITCDNDQRVDDGSVTWAVLPSDTVITASEYSSNKNTLTLTMEPSGELAVTVSATTESKNSRRPTTCGTTRVTSWL